MYLNTSVLKWYKIRLILKECILFLLFEAIGVLLFTLYYPQPISRDTLSKSVTFSSKCVAVYYRLDEKTILYDEQNKQGYRLLFSGGTKKFYVNTYADFSNIAIGTLYSGTELQFCAIFNGKRISYVTLEDFYYKTADPEYNLNKFKKSVITSYYTEAYNEYAVNYREDLTYFFIIFSTALFLFLYIIYKIGCNIATQKYIQRKELLTGVKENGI